jgi:LysM repeat protein
MTAPTIAKSGFDKWQEGLNSAVRTAKWNAYDCEIKATVREYNRHLRATPGYSDLDWHLIKAMLWVETGAGHAQWRSNPMQIGVPGDPGLRAFLEGNEGSDLILPAGWRERLTLSGVRSIPAQNIKAGVGYLLTRLAKFEHRSVPTSDTSAVKECTVQAGNSLASLAAKHSTTVEILKKLNPGATILRPGQILKYRPGKVQQVIVGWRTIDTESIARRYNGGGDPNYSRKLDYAMRLVTKGEDAICE